MKVALITTLAGLLILASQAAPWRDLFNGKDLSGWDTYLAAPFGLNNDPKHVFSVVTQDRAPAIRISGEIYGALTTRAEFTNFHVRLECKWGEKRWPPRENAPRDSGIFYCCQGPHGAASGAWMRSVQCNIMETGIGQWWSVGDSIVDVEGITMTTEMEAAIPYKRESKREKVIVYKPGAPRITATPDSCVTPSFNNEKPRGEWNTVEVIFSSGKSLHVLNGKANLVLSNPRFFDHGVTKPLHSGKIQLQSESAEIFLRNIQIQQIDTIPLEYRRQTSP
jgi:hypothetical protein